jgi:hypothetical protein
MVAEMGNPHEPGRVSATFKQDGKDGTWIVIHGTPAEVRRQVIEVFDMEGQEDQPLYDLINEATRLFKASGNINSALGGRVVGQKTSEDKRPSGGGSAWDRAASGEGEAEQVDPNVTRLTAEIEGVESVDALKELYARNKVHFDGNDDLMAAWKAKGKSLSSS